MIEIQLQTLTDTSRFSLNLLNFLFCHDNVNNENFKTQKILALMRYN